MDSTERLISLLVSTVPELRPTADEHIADNDGLLPHVFFGDFTRWINSRLSTDAFDLPARKALEVLEEAFAAGDPDVRDVLSASFLDNLEPDAPAYSTIRSLLGPRLRKELALYEAL